MSILTERFGQYIFGLERFAERFSAVRGPNGQKLGTAEEARI